MNCRLNLQSDPVSLNIVSLSPLESAYLYFLGNDGIVEVDIVMVAELLAKELYTTYCEAVGGLAHDGKPLPTWDEFRGDDIKRKQSNAWLAVARRVLEAPPQLETLPKYATPAPTR